MELVEHQAHKIKEQAKHIEHLNWKAGFKDMQIETLQRRVLELETLAGIIPGNYQPVPIGYLCVGKNVVGADE